MKKVHLVALEINYTNEGREECFKYKVKKRGNKAILIINEENSVRETK